MNKKTIAISSIMVLLVATIGATVASAKWMNKTETQDNEITLEELIQTYNELKETKQELRDLKESYGMELPDLTDDEKRSLIQTIRQLRRTGHNRIQIRSEITDMLIGFGVNIPGLSIEQRTEVKEKIKIHLEENYNFIFIELTPEQKAYMRQTAIQLKRQGNTIDMIKEELIALYENYGGNIPVLGETDHEEIYNWVYSMIETDYNIDLPDISYEEKQEIEEKKDEIHTLQKELRQQIRQTNWLNRFRFFRYVKMDRTD
jgi:hypothetical protein